jgi:hypothetical protein
VKTIGRGARVFDGHKWTVVAGPKLNISIVGVKGLRRRIPSSTPHSIENRLSYDGAVRTERYGLGDIVPELKNFYGIRRGWLWRRFAILKK